eukprot:jgi/Botrbrau1/8107/Bobra.0308s0002.1
MERTHIVGKPSRPKYPRGTQSTHVHSVSWHARSIVRPNTQENVRSTRSSHTVPTNEQIFTPKGTGTKSAEINNPLQMEKQALPLSAQGTQRFSLFKN